MAVINEKLTRILPMADHPDGPPQVSTVDKPLQVVYQSIILQFSALRFLVCIVAVCIVDVCSALDGYFQQLSNCM